MKKDILTHRFWREQIFPDFMLLVYCLLLLIVGWSFVLWEIEHDQRTTEASIINSNDKLALAFEDHTSHALARVEETLAFLKADFEANGKVTPSVQLLVRQQIGDPLINQSVVTDEKGRPLTSALDNTTNLYNAPQFQAHIKEDTGRVFIGKTRVGLISNKESIHISRRLNHPNGSFAGMVSVAVKPEYFTVFYQSMELGSGHVVALIGLDRAVRASHYPDEAGKIDTASLFAAVARAPVGNYVADRYYSYRVLDKYPLVVQVGISGDVALAGFQQRRFDYLVGCTGVSLLIFLYTGMLMRSSRKQRAMQTRYRALMEQSFDALALVEISTQQVVEVNHSFTELLGYSLPKDTPLYVNRFVNDSQINLDKFYNEILLQQRFTPAEVQRFRHKNGTMLYVETAGTVINIAGKDFFLASMRDMTEAHRRQEEMSRDVEFAREVQRELLPTLPESESVYIRTLYFPASFVSGDTYHLEWQNDGLLLRGFLIDVSGHGLATALQTSAINVLLREISATKLTLLEQLKQVNRRAAKYFTDGSFAAILGFELDLSTSELRYVAAGITQFYANAVKVETPGMFVGLWDDAEFTAGTLPLKEGDSFYFLTDGFTDALAKPDNEAIVASLAKNFAVDVATLEQMGASGKLHDDATGICLKIKK